MLDFLIKPASYTDYIAIVLAICLLVVINFLIYKLLIFKVGGDSLLFAINKNMLNKVAGITIIITASVIFSYLLTKI